MAKRSKKIILLHHCLLNQNARAKGTEKWPALPKKLIAKLVRKNIGIIQLPCPEIEFLGVGRPPRTKKFYNQPKFRKICKRIARETLNLIKLYKKKKYKILGIIGINRSPSCGVTKEKGLLVEEIQRLLEQAELKISYRDDSPL